jgi:hypothetical protein
METTALVFAKTLVRARHVRSFEIAPASSTGWEASLRADETVIERRQYADWHRVERAISRFSEEISNLRHDGWVDA